MQEPKNERYFWLSYADGFFFSLMVGLGETFFAAYALFLGKSEIVTGFILSIPLLLGSLMQLAAPLGLHRVNSHRRWVAATAAAQGLSLLPLLFMNAHTPAVILYLSIALYWAFGLATGPAWNSWITHLVPWTRRSRFFSVRSRFCQFGMLIGLVGGGLLLHFLKQKGQEGLAFWLLFVGAVCARLFSAFCLRAIPDARGFSAQMQLLWPHQLWRELVAAGTGRLLLLCAVFHLCVNTASPFFNPYMLKTLKLSYWHYMILVAVQFAAKMVALYFLESLVHRKGAQRIMHWGLLGVAIIPLVWVASEQYSALLAVQFLSGMAWASFELGLVLTFFEHLPFAKRVSLLSYYNLMTAAAMVAGGSVGAWALKTWAVTAVTYKSIFFLSAGLRFLAYFAIRRWVHLSATAENEPVALRQAG